jgi:DNA-binding beta-propeller fold protein YncE/mono/diheme cytochrome c family protein
MVSSDVLVLDDDSGVLVRTDRDGKKVAALEIGAGASQLVVDAKANKAYVADRNGDRIVVVGLEAGLEQVDAFRTRGEPFGLALTPDARTLLVTTVADASLTAYATESGLERWSNRVGPEPRGVAISASGDEALVTFLTTGVVGRVAIDADDATISYQSIDPAHSLANGRGVFGMLEDGSDRSDRGRSFARNAFAAIYVGNDVAVVPHQLSTPHLADGGRFNQPRSSGYGGGSGFQPPVTHRLAFLAADDGQSTTMKSAFASTNLHQPRAVAYDAGHDTLFVAGYGSDDVLAVANASQASVKLAWKMAIGAGCGPSGLAFDDGAGELVAYCSLTRTTVRLAQDDVGQPFKVGTRSEELSKSHLSTEAQRGREVFRRGNSMQVSTGGAMACASCHAEARSDGLSWFLQGNILQTPFLSGRIEGAHPYKWDGKDRTLKASLTNTVGRLGGSGLGQREVNDLAAFLASSEPPRAPTAESVETVARGKALFESDETGCATCHYGPLLTDQKRHEMSADLPKVDTPSLVGLAHSAPYYHDGSAETLEALLEGKGKVHGMGRISRLTDPQIDDLVAYLETL